MVKQFPANHLWGPQKVKISIKYLDVLNKNELKPSLLTGNNVKNVVCVYVYRNLDEGQL